MEIVDIKKSTRFLPFEDFVIKTALSPTEIIRRLTEALEPRKLIRVSSANLKPFEGEVNGLKFQLNRTLGNHQVYTPFVSGEIVPDGGGSAVHVKMRMSHVGIGFDLLAIASVLIYMLVTGSHAPSSQPFSRPAFFGPIMIVIILIHILSFKSEARNARKFLMMLLAE